MRTSALPFDDIRNLLTLMPRADGAAPSSVPADAARSSGRLAELAAFVMRWRGEGPPRVARPLIALFAASHGFADDALADLADTRARMEAIARGGEPLNRICARFDLGLKVFELALDHPTRDMAQEAAFEEAACVATIAYGMEAIAGGADLLCVSVLGLGSTICAAAICHALFGGAARDWVAVPPDANSRARAIDVVARATQTHAAHVQDPLEILRRLGGRGVAAAAGAILGARMERVPVVLDGYAATAAAAVLRALDSSALDHCVASQVNSGDPHREALRRIGKEPLLALGSRDDDDGCGAALAALLLQAAASAAGDP